MKTLLRISTCVCVATVASLSTPANGQIITSGLRLQLDATAITGVNNGEELGSWLDLSGNANNFAQITPDDRPIYFSSGINGLAAIQFGGGLLNPDTKVMNLVSGGSGLDITGNGLTIFAVVQYYSASGEQALLGNYGGGGTGYLLYKHPSNNSFVFEGKPGVSGGSFVLDEPTIVTAMKSTTGVSLYQDGSQVGTAAGTDPLISSSQTFTIGWSEYVSTNLRGYVGEILIYDRTLDSGEIAQVSDYLNDKWINPIPEPSTFALAALGGLAAFLLRGKIRRK